MTHANAATELQTADIKLDPGIDVARLREQFKRAGHVRITPFLSDAIAVRIAEHLEQRDDWHMVVNAGEKVFEIDGDTAQIMGEERLATLDRAVHEAARDGFQFRYSSIRVPDASKHRRGSDDALHAFATFLSSPAVLSLIREITCRKDVDFADSQATRYGVGDFLTAHDDAVPGKNRHAAYVFGLTCDWRTEWGGLLLFHHADRRVTGLAPDFNALDLFAVPIAHSVSYVAPFAGKRRQSITGWFRSGQP